VFINTQKVVNNLYINYSINLSIMQIKVA